MKIKQIIFVAIFCVSAQFSCPIFGGEQRIQETGWRSWVPERFRQHVAKPFVTVAGPIAVTTLPLLGVVDPSMDMLGAIGLLSVGGGLLNIVVENALTVAQKSLTQYTTQKLVDQLAQLIEPIVADNLAYPTYSTKMHALLKRNEFFGDVLKTYQERVGENVADEIFRLACSKVSEKIMKAKKTEQESHQLLDYNQLYKKIDEEIALLNKQLAAGAGTGEEAALLEAKLDRISKLLSNDPKCAAFVSVVLRLKNQQLVEIQNAGTYKKTSAAKFYTPMSTEEKEAVEKRHAMPQEQWKLYRQKKAAETGKPLLERGG